MSNNYIYKERSANYIIDTQQTIARFDATGLEHWTMWSNVGNDQWEFATTAKG